MNALGSIDNNNTCGASNWKPRVPSKAEFEVTNNLDGTTTINYTIKCGDTLYHISRAIKEHFGIDISYQAIADQNGIANAGKIKAGQSLEIEVGKSKASAAPSKPKEKSAPKEKPASLPQPIYEEGSPYDLYTTQPVIMSENVPLEWWEEEVDVSLSDADVVVEPEAEDPLPSSLAAMCRQDPSWLEDVLVRNNLVMEARGAIRDGNYDLAREDAAQLVMSGGDKALDNAADLYFEIGDSLFAQGRYEEAEQVYWEVAHRFDGANRKTPVFEADSVEVQGRFGSFYLDNVHLNISELANARMAQCQFLERAEVSDPFDLSEVGRYFRSLPSNRLADELNTYLSAFYFHPRTDIVDTMATKDLSGFPLSRFGQKPADCRMFALITKKLLKPGWSEETGYTFKDVYCYIETGSPDKSSHQMLLVEMGIEGGFLLSNNRAYWLDRTDERSIERKVSELLYRQDTMEELSDDDLVRLPQFYLVVLEEGQALEENSSKAKKISYMSPDL